MFSVHAGLVAFLFGRVVVNRLRCGNVVECELFFRDGAPHLGVVVRLVLPTGVPPLLEGYEAIFVIELYQMAFRCVVAFPEGLLPHELTKSVAAVVLAGAVRSKFLRRENHCVSGRVAMSVRGA